ncbi:hypothetical protein H0I39_02630 [Ottowia beijingensis]|uniref:Uncharacterized protein n=1 Tax=Ottowia beijingensis TaxID=1207057 RepID=A0A853IPZ5_9BURK|nr:hypothetical protein [Ottowia beijingensis]NZA00945.1 hypothetical protein [Ottowia beijingensis]
MHSGVAKKPNQVQINIANRQVIRKKLGAENIPSVNGFPFKSTDQLAEFLFEIDFIVGEKGGKHTQYQHDPTLFSSEHNAQNKIPWIVNLSYRKFLGIQ